MANQPSTPSKMSDSTAELTQRIQKVEAQLHALSGASPLIDTVLKAASQPVLTKEEETQVARRKWFQQAQGFCAMTLVFIFADLIYILAIADTLLALPGNSPSTAFSKVACSLDAIAGAFVLIDLFVSIDWVKKGAKPPADIDFGHVINQCVWTFLTIAVLAVRLAVGNQGVSESALNGSNVASTIGIVAFVSSAANGALTALGLGLPTSK